MKRLCAWDLRRMRSRPRIQLHREVERSHLRRDIADAVCVLGVFAFMGFTVATVWVGLSWLFGFLP